MTRTGRVLNGLLLDTHTLLWFGFGDPRLPKRLVDQLASEDVFVSELSRLEITIKEQARNMSFGLDVDKVIDRAGFTPLPVEVGVHRKLQTMPMHHSDPFDRMLIAQAMLSGLALVSRDRHVRLYDVSVIW